MVAMFASACGTRAEPTVEPTPPFSDGAVLGAVKAELADRLIARSQGANCLTVLQRRDTWTVVYEAPLSYRVTHGGVSNTGVISWRYWISNGAVEPLSRFC